MTKIDGNEQENPSFKIDIFQTALKMTSKKVQTMAASGPVDFGAAVKQAFAPKAQAPKEAPKETPKPASPSSKK